MWRNYFNIVKIVPGKVKTNRHGLIDLSRDDLDIQRLKELHDQGFPYLELTEEGRKALYPSPEALSSPEPLPEPGAGLLPTPPPEIPPTRKTKKQ